MFYGTSTLAGLFSANIVILMGSFYYYFCTIIILLDLQFDKINNWLFFFIKKIFLKLFLKIFLI